MSSADIVNALQPRVNAGRQTLWMFVWINLTVALVTLVLEGMNIAGYARNATMLSVHLAVTVVTLGIVCYGVILTSHIGALSRRDQPLVETVRAQLGFFRVRLEIWLWMAAVTGALLAFAVVTLVDNQNGSYRINQPLVFWVTQLVMLLFLYGTWKVASLPVVQGLRATLEDIQSQLLENTAAVERRQRHWRRWRLLLVILGAIFLLLGIWRALQMTVP